MRLDTEQGVREAFGDGLEASEAWRRILSDDPDERMPPPEAEKSISGEERQLLRRWILAGAPWSGHWAFQRPARPSLPRGDSPAGEHRGAIDAFVNERLASEGLHPEPEADRQTLIRRLSFDLIGLPPSPEEIDAFLADESPDAYSKLVDRLLASPHFGERWAIDWLDLARYADTNGYQNDFNRTMWPYRDWVISALNDNMPFDQFTIEQLAGDLLPGATREQRIASAFNRNNRTVTEAGSLSEEWLVENVIDRVETTGATWLGLTMGCSRCHDHKFDPISQREFYEFFAFFHNIDEQGVYNEQRGNVGPQVRLPTAEQEQGLAELARRLEEARSRVAGLESGLDGKAEAWLTSLADSKIEGVPLLPESLVAIDLDGDWSARGPTEAVAPKEPHSQPDGPLDTFLGVVARFDGERHLDFGDLVAPEADRAFALSLWVKTNESGALLSKMDDEAQFRGFDLLVADGGKLIVHLVHSWPDNAIKVRTKAKLATGDWQHVVVSYDGSSKATGLRVYFQGVEQPVERMKDSLAGTIETTQPLRIGTRSTGSRFQGAIGRIRFYDHPPTAVQARQMTLFDAANGLRAQSDEGLASEAIRDEGLAFYRTFAPDEPSSRFRDAKIDLEQIEKSRRDLEAGIPTVMVMQELPEPRDTYVLHRGEYDKPDKKQKVQSGVPGFLPPLPEGVKRDRLALARWIVDEENPLTARVMVNRVWEHLFGTGIVKSTENFGVQADPPSHPRVLDWLACEFIESGWDLKHLIKTVVTSDTYRRSPHLSRELAERDPENRLLARGVRLRLPAELIRDNALAVSGLLDRRIGGPPVFPYQPEGLWEELAGGANGGPYKQSAGADLHRRTLYTFRKRTVPQPVMATFDAPSFEYCVTKRSRTNTPLQALALLNDPTYVEASIRLGERMLSDGARGNRGDLSVVAQRVTYGFRMATGRHPGPAETSKLVEAVERYHDHFKQQPEAAKKFLSLADLSVSAEASAVDLAAYGTLASVLINLDATITRE